MKTIYEYNISPIPRTEQKDLISVCVAVYNSKDYLRRSLCSITAQSYKNLEIILVDDGSTDGSGEICDEFAAADSRIKVIHKTNGGLYTSRNTGIEAASGDYICFLDGDDYIDTNMYENMLSAIKREKADLCVCRYRQVYDDEVIDGSTGMAVIFDGQEILEQYLKEDEKYLIQNSAWNKLYRRSLIRDLRFPSRWYEDMLYTPELLALPAKSIYMDRAYHNYICTRSGSIMNMGINKRIFSDLIPNYYDRSAYLESIGRHDLALISDYHLYKKMLIFVRDVYRSSDPDKKRHLKYLDDHIRENRDKFPEIYGIESANLNEYRKMKIYLRLPSLFNPVMDINEKYVIPVKQKILAARNKEV